MLPQSLHGERQSQKELMTLQINRTASKKGLSFVHTSVHCSFKQSGLPITPGGSEGDELNEHQRIQRACEMKLSALFSTQVTMPLFDDEK